MQITFYKYQGTGNDFVILDNRSGQYNQLTKEQINFICRRRTGIGADGLMLLNNHKTYDFEMKYYNADGKEGSMCGNGGRCLIQFANDRGIVKDKYHFTAIDGEHEATMEAGGAISLHMNDVKHIREYDEDFVLDTGSPHYVKLTNDVMHMDVYKCGRDIRYSGPFEQEGINVNFVERVRDNASIIVRTYERGVEDETLSCGTGVTAAALVCCHNETGYNNVTVQTKGGALSVEYEKYDDVFKNIWLSGPAQKVFEGMIDIAD